MFRRNNKKLFISDYHRLLWWNIMELFRVFILMRSKHDGKEGNVRKMMANKIILHQNEISLFY